MALGGVVAYVQEEAERVESTTIAASTARKAVDSLAMRVWVLAAIGYFQRRLSSDRNANASAKPAIERK